MTIDRYKELITEYAGLNLSVHIFFRHRLRTPDINNKYNASFVYDVLEYSIRSKDLFMKIKNLK